MGRPRTGASERTLTCGSPELQIGSAVGPPYCVKAPSGHAQLGCTPAAEVASKQLKSKGRRV
eukprot:11729506-Alexandrium_andersonii.AAC.1